MDCDDMCAHIERLIAKLREDRFRDPDDLHVHWINDRNKAQALNNTFPVEVWLPRIRLPQDYAMALHEIGHICGRYQKSAKVMTRERWAWDWARRNAQEWTQDMEQEAQASLEWYEEHHRTFGVE